MLPNNALARLIEQARGEFLLGASDVVDAELFKIGEAKCDFAGVLIERERH